MLRIGLTGGIGSGKSTVAKVFRVLNVPVFEADAEGRRLLKEDAEVGAAVRDRFGPSVHRDGLIDRKALGAIVFNDKQALADLNGIIHPAVRASFNSWASEQTAPYVVMEAAILAETGAHKAFDRILVVTAPEELRIRRVMERDGVEEDAVRARMSNQLSEDVRNALADHLIENDDRQLVIPEVLAIHNTLLEQASR